MENDTYTRDGAEMLAETIRDFWRSKGEPVRVWIEPIIQNRFKGCLFSVRSDLVNGLPRRVAA